MKKTADFTKPIFRIVDRIEELDLSDSVKELLRRKEIFSLDALEKQTRNEKTFDMLVDNDGQKKLEIIKALNLINDYSQTVELSPLPSGYGITIGNALRRVLLASMPGVAIIAVTIAGVNNEFSIIEGVYQDVTQIILNIKDIVLKYADNSKLFEQGNQEVYTLSIKTKGKQTICAKDLICPSELEIVNGEKVIATITKDSCEFEAQLYAVRGVGYSIADINKSRIPQLKKDLKIIELNKSFIIPIDAIFTPIKKFTFEVIKTRDEQVYNLDKLLMTIDTNLSIDYKDAIALAAEYLTQYFTIISNISEEIKKHQYIIDTTVEDKEVVKVADVNLIEIGLPNSTFNKLCNGLVSKYNKKVNTVSELLEFTQKELKEIPGFGESSVKKVVELLKEKGYEMVAKKKDTSYKKTVVEEEVIEPDRIIDGFSESEDEE